MEKNKSKSEITPKSVIELARKQGAKMVDVKFVDTFGTWQHFSVPVAELTEEVFEEGFGFDGSSIRGWKSIEASDMLAMPDPASYTHVPWEPTLARFASDIYVEGESWPYCPRTILKRETSGAPIATS